MVEVGELNPMRSPKARKYLILLYSQYVENGENARVEYAASTWDLVQT